MSESDFQVTQKQAAEFLNVSTKTISRYRKKGLPFKMILNPVTGKQEVRFRQADLSRWHEGRSLLATYGQEGSPAPAKARTVPNPLPATTAGHGNGAQAPQADYLADLLAVYKDQIQMLREQLADMRGQLARRDRQIDDLMRLMVGLQLEYKPEADEPEMAMEEKSAREYSSDALGKKIFSRKELSDSILRLRQRGKSYQEIARGLNHINAAPLPGRSSWTESDVQSLLPPIVETNHSVIEL